MKISKLLALVVALSCTITTNSNAMYQPPEEENLPAAAAARHHAGGPIPVVSESIDLTPQRKARYVALALSSLLGQAAALYEPQEFENEFGDMRNVVLELAAGKPLDEPYSFFVRGSAHDFFLRANDKELPDEPILGANVGLRAVERGLQGKIRGCPR